MTDTEQTKGSWEVLKEMGIGEVFSHRDESEYDYEEIECVSGGWIYWRVIRYGKERFDNPAVAGVFVPYDND